MKKIAFLKNPIQQYAWGSRTFIPELLGHTVPSAEPQAELWMGAHPKAPSLVLTNGLWTPLNTLIQQQPEIILGKHISKKFSGNLPFLFKILAAAEPLSIQAHPNKIQARQGYKKENELNIKISDPQRNYRDQNHKPEIICALTSFWALKGFRKVQEILHFIDALGLISLRNEVEALNKQPSTSGLKSFFKALMDMEAKKRSRVISEATAMATQSEDRSPEYKWVSKLYEKYPQDIGVLSPLFLNLIQLQPGEALYLPEGELHAYLDGAGIELMANSDNVLRGGLTPKHVDASELLNVLQFIPGDIDVLLPAENRGGEHIYQTGAKEFQLSLISLGKGITHQSPPNRNVEMMICTEGDAQIFSPGEPAGLAIDKGTSILVPAAAGAYQIQGEARIFKASVPSSAAN